MTAKERSPEDAARKARWDALPSAFHAAAKSSFPFGPGERMAVKLSGKGMISLMEHLEAHGLKIVPTDFREDPAGKIDVTPEMIEAGVTVLEKWNKTYNYNPAPIPADEDLIRAILSSFGSQAGLTLYQAQGDWIEFLPRIRESDHECEGTDQELDQRNRFGELVSALSDHQFLR